MKYLILAVLLFAGGVLLASFEHPPQSFTPIVRVRSSEGLYITLVQPKQSERSACSAAVDGFIEALGDTCPTCAIESTECATKLQGIDKGLAAGERLPIYTVAAGGIRVGLLGRPGSVKAECEAMAAQFLHSGIRSAACIGPSNL